MKNDEIIENIARELYGDAQVDAILQKGAEIPLHVIQIWRKKGFRVRKNEKGVACKLWRRRKGEKNDCQYYLSKAFLFSREQVEPDEKAD
jgi:hypothetical protein